MFPNFFNLSVKTYDLELIEQGTCAARRCPTQGGRAQPHIPASAAPISWRTRATLRRSASQDSTDQRVFAEKHCGGARCRTILELFLKLLRKNLSVLWEVA